MTTTFIPDLALSKVKKHPHNPRHSATADAELVESVKTQGLVQPIVVAPVNGSDTWVLIAGHRRLDALKKAKEKTAPAIVRSDLVTDGQQIEAMLIENGRREDLSPIEEAEGYHQLELLGYKPQAIATAVGRDVKTVRSRLKLLDLSAATKKKVHAGQLTLDEAAAFNEFADDPEATKRLEKAAADGQLKYAIGRERSTRERAQQCAADVAELAAAGAKPYDLPKGKQLYDLHGLGVRLLYTTTPAEELAAQHDGCLAYLEAGGSCPQVHRLCTDPDRHAADEEAHVSAEQARHRAEWEERQQAHRERVAAEEAAAKVRVGTILDLFGTATAMPPALRDVARALIPALLVEADTLGTPLTHYIEHIGIPDEDRWTNLYADASTTLFKQHVADVDRWSDGILTRALVLLLISYAESNLTSVDGGADALLKVTVGRYLDLLEKTGHEFCDIDNEIRAALTGDAEQEAS